MAITGSESTPLIKTPIPGPRAKAIIKRDEQFMMTTTKTAPLVGHEARGAVVEDVDGNRLLDFASGIGVLNTGHCHPKVVAAVQDQAARLMHFAGTDFYYDVQTRLAERVTKKVPIPGRSKLFYCQSGTEANEAAIKIAKAGTGRPLFLAFLGAFHGRTQGSLALTASKTKHKQAFFGMMGGVTHVPFPNPYRNTWRIDGYADPAELSNRAMEYLEGILDTVVPPQDVAGLFWEPVQGEGGYVVPPKMFPGALRKLCVTHGIQLIADEVQTGFGRTGKWFATEHYGIEADIVTVAKAMGSGFPIGATIARADLDYKEKGRHSNTYGGNLVGCAASMATMDVIEEEDLVRNSARMGDRMGRQMQEMMDGHEGVGDHRGLGLMRALEFVTREGAPDPKLRDAVEQQAWKRGLITLGCGKSSLRVIPPLNVTREQVDGGMAVLREALSAAKA
ncbi:MAG TPA: acetyl ornithine aminotransferase family protein [Candidatus Thermoplasmatota archaeon]|nr:acetyl ornithine aminotransferase family protein [Candidatus Thermoplasmatota archaeon]